MKERKATGPTGHSSPLLAFPFLPTLPCPTLPYSLDSLLPPRPALLPFFSLQRIIDSTQQSPSPSPQSRYPTYEILPSPPPPRPSLHRLRTLSISTKGFSILHSRTGTGHNPAVDDRDPGQLKRSARQAQEVRTYFIYSLRGNQIKQHARVSDHCNGLASPLLIVEVGLRLVVVIHLKRHTYLLQHITEPENIYNSNAARFYTSIARTVSVSIPLRQFTRSSEGRRGKFCAEQKANGTYFRILTSPKFSNNIPSPHGRFELKTLRDVRRFL